MIFSIPDSGYRIVLAGAVVKVLGRHRQRFAWNRERGGLLFADSDEISAQDVRIAEASPPHPRDRGSRYGLKLDHVRCVEEVREANRRGLVFVGYWHTHPERVPEISHQDISSFYENLREGSHGLTQLLAVIVGTRAEAAGMAGYLVSSQRETRLIAA